MFVETQKITCVINNMPYFILSKFVKSYLKNDTSTFYIRISGNRENHENHHHIFHSSRYLNYEIYGFKVFLILIENKEDLK